MRTIADLLLQFFMDSAICIVCKKKQIPSAILLDNDDKIVIVST